jgi:hypothetical protein
MKLALRSPPPKLAFGLWLLWPVLVRPGYSHGLPETVFGGCQVVRFVCLKGYSRPYLRAVGPPAVWFEEVPQPPPAPEPVAVAAGVQPPPPPAAVSQTAGSAPPPPPPPPKVAPETRPEVRRPAILPDETRPKVRPEDFVPYFQPPDPQPVSTATYHQS